MFLATVPLLGRYWYNYRRYGSPFYISWWDKPPYPFFMEKTYYGNPGVTSIASSYLTFRLVDLIKNPVISDYVTDVFPYYPLHRESLWTQLYARAHFVYFTGWPPTWQTNSKVIFNMGRIIFILALVPTFILLLGIMREAKKWIVDTVKWKFSFIEKSNDWIFGIFFLLYVLFISTYTFIYRDLSFMKVIYIYPALLPAIYLFTQGVERIDIISKKHEKLRVCFNVTFGLLFTLYFLTIAILIRQLYLINF